MQHKVWIESFFLLFFVFSPFSKLATAFKRCSDVSAGGNELFFSSFVFYCIYRHLSNAFHSKWWLSANKIVLHTVYKTYAHIGHIGQHNINMQSIVPNVFNKPRTPNYSFSSSPVQSRKHLDGTDRDLCATTIKLFSRMLPSQIQCHWNLLVYANIRNRLREWWLRKNNGG